MKHKWKRFQDLKLEEMVKTVSVCFRNPYIYQCAGCSRYVMCESNELMFVAVKRAMKQQKFTSDCGVEIIQEMMAM